MMTKMIAAILALSFMGLLALAPDAEAKRRCPRGQDDVNNVCVPKR
jgi:hypothetical protein